MNEVPFVSVGIPTFNRARTLRRAIDSILAQDYPNFQLIISDNASSDGTETMCEEYRQRDPRIKYIRQPENRGVNANFRAVLGAAEGELFMWLGDDDWLDPNYLGACARFLAQHDGFQLASGRGKYFFGEEFSFSEDDINLADDSGAQRVLAYYRQVKTNGIFYGLMRRRVLQELEVHTVIGGDWLLMSDIAFLGKIKTLNDVFFNRSMAGISQNAATLTALHNLPAFVARDPFALIAWNIFRDIGWQSRIYKPLGRIKRFRLAFATAAIVFRRYSLPVWRKSWRDTRSRARAAIRLRTRLRAVLAKFGKDANDNGPLDPASKSLRGE